MQFTRETIDDLAFLYMTLAYHADGNLTEDEKEAMRLLLNVWSDDFISAEMTDIIDYAQRATNRADKEGRLGHEVVSIITRLGGKLSKGKQKIILSDLISVARIDGMIHQNEEALIRTAADAWGFQIKQDAFLLSTPPEAKRELIEEKPRTSQNAIA